MCTRYEKCVLYIQIWSDNYHERSWRQVLLKNIYIYIYSKVNVFKTITGNVNILNRIIENHKIYFRHIEGVWNDDKRNKVIKQKIYVQNSLVALHYKKFLVLHIKVTFIMFIIYDKYITLHIFCNFVSVIYFQFH